MGEFQKGGLPLSVAILGLVIISAFAALFFGLFGFVRGYLKVPHFITDPILWVSIEYLWGLIIPWGFVGYSLWKIKPLIQIAELTGVYGLSYLIIFVSSLFCEKFWGQPLTLDVLVCLVHLLYSDGLSTMVSGTGLVHLILCGRKVIS